MLSISLVLLSGNANALNLSKEKIVKSFSAAQMSDAANFFRVIADGKASGKAYCELKPEVALKLVNSIHPLYDERVEALASQYKTKKINSKKILKWSKECPKDCRCGLYSDLADTLADKTLPADQSAFASIRASAQAQTESQSITCAKDKTWICGSKLLRYLEEN
jgi:hypothetical protein